MKLYLYMMLSGSVGTILYILCNYILPFELKLKWKRIYLHVNMLFYLFPIPFVLSEIKITLRSFLASIGLLNVEAQIYTFKPNSMLGGFWVVGEEEQLKFLSGMHKWLPVLIVVSCFFLFGLFRWIYMYVNTGRALKKCLIYDKANEQEVSIGKGKRTRKIVVARTYAVPAPFTIGIARPIIVLPVEDEDYVDAMEGVINHEVTHITNRDGLIRLLAFLIIALEWFNPLVYFQYKELIKVSELLCDEAATEGMTISEKKKYAECLISASEEKVGEETVVMALAQMKNLTRERTQRIMKMNTKKVLGGALAALVLACSLLISSLPALAYEQPVRFGEGILVDSANGQFENVDWTAFVPLEFAAQDCLQGDVPKLDFSICDTYFVSEDGEIFPIYEEMTSKSMAEVKAVCNHVFVDGYCYKHEVVTGGGCMLHTYSAKMCKLCQYVKDLTFISTATYAKCIH